MIDLHPILGIDAVDLEPCVQHPVPFLYDIPLRACVSRDVSNLMFAGRNISATHIAFAATRVMATCAVIGQGVGVAAAHAALEHILPAELATRRDAILAIQQQLLRNDAYLIGHDNQDDRDLARQAEVTASSESPGGEAVQVISGQTRSVHGDKGAPPARACAGSHRWMSDPAQGLPASIRLDWKEPVAVAEIQLIFDTGLHRHLTLSHHDGYSSRMVWGEPQPETVRDYKVERFDGDHWHTVAEVTGNYQRMRRHSLAESSPQLLSAIRVQVEQTNGLDHARICEVRVT